MNINKLDKNWRSPIRLFNLIMILVFALSLAAPTGALAQADTETPVPPADTPVPADTAIPTQTLVPTVVDTPVPTLTNTSVPAVATVTNTLPAAPTVTNTLPAAPTNTIVAPTPAKGAPLGAPPVNPKMLDSSRTLATEGAGTSGDPWIFRSQPVYFQWDDNGSTDYYVEVHVDNPSSYVNSYWYPHDASGCSNVAPIAPCIGLAMSTFPENTKLWWTVRGRNDATATAPVFFKIMTDKPILYSPNETSTNVTISMKPKFCWAPPPSGTYAGTYNLYLEGPSGTVVESQMGLPCGGVGVGCPAGSTCNVLAQNDLYIVGTYTWHIVLDNGVVSLPKLFHTSTGGAPGNAVQSSPADGSSNESTTPTFIWNIADRATTYALVIQNAVTRAEVLKKIYKATDPDCQGGVCKTIIPPATLNPGQYIWFVESRNSEGKGFYTPWTFRVVTQAGKKPVLVSPSGNVNLGTTFKANFIWYRVSDATSYKLIIYGPKINSTTIPLTSGVTPNFTCVAPDPTCSYRPDVLLTQDATYTWWIKAVYDPATSTLGEVTSDPKTFKVIGASVKPDPVGLNTPSYAAGPPEVIPDVDANQVSFDWDREANERAAAYLLAVQNADTGEYVIWKWYMADDPECNTTTPPTVCNTHYPGTDNQWFKLTPGNYVWRVDSWNSVGQTPSEVWKFRAIVQSGAVPQLISPSGDTNVLPDMCPTYTWSKVNGAAFYHIQVYGSGLNWDKADYTPTDVGCNNASDTFCRLQDPCDSVTPLTNPPTLQANKSYTWRVSADSPAWATWSSTMTFKVIPPLPNPVTLIAPANGVEDIVKPTFKWWPDLTATYYLLAVFDSKGTSIIWKWYSPEEALCGNRVFDLNTCQIDSPIILGGGEYTWRVESYNPNGQLPSKTWKFTVVPGPGDKPDLIAPGNNKQETTDKPVFQWNDPNDPVAVQYFLSIKNKSTSAQVFYRGFTPVIANPLPTDQQLADESGGFKKDILYCDNLLPNRLCKIKLKQNLGNGWYTWQVAASDGGTGQTPSEVWNFEVVFSGDFPIHLIRPSGTTNLRYERYEFEIVDDDPVLAGPFRLRIGGPNGVVWPKPEIPPVDKTYIRANICTGTLCAIDSTIADNVPELYLGSYTWWIEDSSGPPGIPLSNTIIHTVSVQIPEQTTLIDPADGAVLTIPPPTPSNPKFSWNRKESASWYLLVVYNSKGNAVVYQWLTKDTANCPKYGDTCYSYPSSSGVSLANGVYTWRVDTYNSAGQVPSQSQTFTVAAPPETPVLLTPLNSTTITTYTPTLTWEKPPALPTSYRLFLTYIDGSVEYNVFNDPQIIDPVTACPVVGTTCQYTFAAPLTKYGKWHYWVISSKTSSAENPSLKWRFYVPYP